MAERGVIGRFGESPTAAGWFRIGMAVIGVVLSVLGWSLTRQVDNFDLAVRDVTGHVEIVASALVALDKRVTAIEASRQVAIANAEASRVAIMNRLDDLFRGQSDQSSKLAALAAKVDALKDRMDSRPERYGQNIPPQ